VRQTESGWLYLLLRAYRYWDFPKGIVEKGEEPFLAALRELREETGIKQASPKWGYEFHETAAYSHGKIARYYLAEVTESKVVLLPNREEGLVEHHEYRWLPYPEARKLLVPRVQAALDWAHRLQSPPV
jgi:bis(5'-nucleosidyl)-tetraphosphatase